MSDLTRLPGAATETWDWQLRGSCRDLDTAMFFHPDRERGAARDLRVAKAKEICQSCPVLVECRNHALTVQEPYGVWGGLDESERRHAVKRRRQFLQSA
ncbi:WhiB family redox-sensing transcriptional regulator [Herbihabitans rhizosphaerae]|uniref:Transcriptional regulator WhiB n=1 Tax=Herbihabitans rhizosphaerae TaxID=1872711 RepID=A0A4Q7KK31_9PSEU|nr:WhiB family transcriptional regulator [Herbihabitans rhizosphaerae]RZS36566.1 WhiB family redox-sensing transcriptional regulator [Herbihabitans rhizosphaerae]